MRRRTALFALAAFTLATASRARADIMMTAREGMNVTTLLESSSMTLRVLQETYGLGDAPLTFTGSYSDTGGTLTVTGDAAGQPLSLTLTSTLTGDLGGDINVAVTGTGSWLGAPIATTGQTSWLFDSSLNDYQAMDYDDQGTFGTGSRSWVVRGAELLVGAGVGGWLGGWGGAFTGALAAWTISDIVYEGGDALTPPPPPTQPTTPSTPSTPPPSTPPPAPPNQIIDVITGSDNTVYKNNGNVINGRGAFNDGAMSGTYAVVPEPSSLLLLVSAGAVGLGWAGRRRAA